MRAALLALALVSPPQQPPLRVPAPAIELGAITPEERQAAARKLVPLLRALRQKASGQIAPRPGTAPNSPFTGTPTTLVAVTIGRQAVAVDPEVVKAMDRLIRWRIADPAAADDAALFDRWLGELAPRAVALGFQAGAPATCHTPCIVERMTTLDELWGPNPRVRAEFRDRALVEALAAALK